MTAVRVPSECPYCQGKSFARLRTLYLDVIVGESQQRPERPHYFTLIMCSGCGKTDWFAQDPRTLISEFASYAAIVASDPDGAGPYR